MIVLDQNYPKDQREILRSWRIPIRQIGFEIGRAGMKDDELVPFLIQLSLPAFFTLDRGWYERRLLHPRYGLILLEVRDSEVASFTRRVLKHPGFSTRARRLAKVVRASHDGLTGWVQGSEAELHWSWS